MDTAATKPTPFTRHTFDRIAQLSIITTTRQIPHRCAQDLRTFVPNEALRETFRRYCLDRAKQGPLKSPLFLNAVGRRLRSQTFRKRLRVLSHRLGIAPHLTPHRFRHSAVTLLVEEGIDIRMVQALLGHANLRTTEVYVQVSNTALQRALERVNVLDCLQQ